MNRVIDGIDLEGLEWSASTSNTSSGRPVIDIQVNVSVPDLFNTLGMREGVYKAAIQAEFDKVLKSSGRDVSGTISFGPATAKGRAVPTANFTEDRRGILTDPNKIVIAGIAAGSSWSQELYSKAGALLSPEAVAETFVHELLHTARLRHPYETTQSADTKLVKVGLNSYKSTSTTSIGIGLNVMNYSFLKFDGLRGDSKLSTYNLLGGNGRQNMTSGQLVVLLHNIELQQNGTGAATISDPYWYDEVGEPVESKQSGN